MAHLQVGRLRIPQHLQRDDPLPCFPPDARQPILQLDDALHPVLTIRNDPRVEERPRGHADLCTAHAVQRTVNDALRWRGSRRGAEGEVGELGGEVGRLALGCGWRGRGTGGGGRGAAEHAETGHGEARRVGARARASELARWRALAEAHGFLVNYPDDARSRVFASARRPMSHPWGTGQSGSSALPDTPRV